jgi:hypothetical protein
MVVAEEFVEFGVVVGAKDAAGRHGGFGGSGGGSGTIVFVWRWGETLEREMRRGEALR